MAGERLRTLIALHAKSMTGLLERDVESLDRSKLRRAQFPNDKVAVGYIAAVVASEIEAWDLLVPNRPARRCWIRARSQSLPACWREE